MKSTAWSGALLLVLVLFNVGNQSASGLSLAYCEESSVECQVQNCHNRNIAKNWPIHRGGEEENCDELEKQLKRQKNQTPIIVGLILMAGAGASYMGYSKIKQQSSAQNRKK